MPGTRPVGESVRHNTRGAYRDLLQLSTRARVLYVVSVLLLSVGYEAGDGGVPPQIIMLSIVTQLVALALVLVTLTLAARWFSGQRSTWFLIVTLAASQFARALVGHLIALQYAPHTDLLLQRVVFAVSIGLVWGPCFSYVMAQLRQRRLLLAEEAATTHAIEQDRAQFINERRQSRHDLREALETQIRPRLAVIAQKVGHDDDLKRLGELADELAALSLLVQPRRGPAETDEQTSPSGTPASWWQATALPTRQAGRAFAVTQGIICVLLLPLALHMGAGSQVTSLVITQLIACGTFAAALRALRVPGPKFAIAGVGIRSACVVAGLSASVSVATFTSRHFSLPGIVPLSLLQGLIAGVVCAAGGWFGIASTSIAKQNRAHVLSTRVLTALRADLRAEVLDLRRALDGLTHNSVQSPLAGSAMALRLSLDGALPIEDVRPVVLTQLHAVTVRLDELNNELKD